MMESKTKIKVIAGFSTAIILILLAMFIAYSSFSDLMSSINYLSKPDTRLEKINIIIAQISGTENNIRSYVATGNKEYLKQYDYYFLSVKRNIDTLKSKSDNNNSFENNIDTIAKLWEQKRNDFNFLIKLYNKKPALLNPKKTIKILSKIGSDTISQKTVVTKTTETTLKNEPTKDSKEIKNIKEINDDKGIFFSTIKRVFTKKEKEPALPKESQTTTEVKISVDSNFIRFSKKDSSLSNLINSISRQQLENYKKELKLSKSEIAILQRNQVMLNHIMTIVTQLKREEIEFSNKNLISAKSIADKSTTILGWLGIVCFIGMLFFIYIIIQDLSKSNYYRKELLSSKKNAEKLTLIKQEFLSNMSHEIRTPLNSIIGFTEQLAHTSLENKQKYFINALENSSEHLLNIINNILDFSKIESSSLHFENKPFSIKKTLYEACESQKIFADEKDVNFTYSFKEEIPNILIGDSFRLKQILLNLISNAIKFTSEGSIAVSMKHNVIKEGACKITIEIQDTGIGISEGQLKIIFDSFSQADASITRKYGGTGLGLSITKKLIELQQGNIKVKSTLGIGSTFIVELPYQFDKTISILPTLSSTPHSFENISGKKILVVEDDELNALLLHTILKKWNINLTITSNGFEALYVLEKNKFDLIITDLQMPDMPGIDLIKNIKKSPGISAQVPILLLTANINKEEIMNYLNEGMSDYLLKPFKENILFEKISNLLLTTSNLNLSKEETNNSIQNKKYNIDDFIKFSGSDTKALHHILETLITNSKIDVQNLSLYATSKKWKQTGEIAHKMYSSFSHLKVNTICKDLVQIQDIIDIEKNEKKIMFLVTKIQVEVADVLDCLEKDFFN